MFKKMEAKTRFDAALIAAVVSLVTANAAMAADKEVTKSATTTDKTTTVSDKKDSVTTKVKEKTTTKEDGKAPKTTVKATEKTTKKAGKESACGKGSCGTDEKGAKAASEAHSKTEVKKETKVEKK